MFKEDALIMYTGRCRIGSENINKRYITPIMHVWIIIKI